MAEDIKTSVSEMNLNEIAKGFTRFSIRADDTAENRSVHEAFKEFCKIETDNNYTLGLRKLLEFYQSDYKFEMLHNAITQQNVVLEELKGSVEELKAKPKQEEENEDSNAF